jgi:hypothetical protein
MNFQNRKENTHTVLTKGLEQKLKRLKFWKEKYLKVLAEVKEIYDALGKGIDDNKINSSEPTQASKEGSGVKDDPKKQKIDGIDLGTVNDKTEIDIPKAPPPPPKKVEEVKKNTGASHADLMKEIKEKVKEGVKASDLKKQNRKENE